MSDDKSTQIDKALGALGTLERATEFQTFLLLSSLAFSLNITLTLTHQTNLVGFSWQYVKDNLPIGQGLVFLTGFTLYMSCIVNILRYVADQLVGSLVVSLTLSLGSTQQSRASRGRPINMVRAYELLDAARDEEDGTYLALRNEHVDKKGEDDAAAWRTASLSFGLLVLLAIDATLPANTSLSAVVIHFLNSIFTNLGIFIGGVVLLVLLASWLFRFIEDDFDRGWIMCPKLYAKLDAERQKKVQGQHSTTHRDAFD